MKQDDMEMFTEEEVAVVDNSFDRYSLPARFRNVILGAFIAAALAVVLVVLDASATTVAIAFVGYVAIVTLEKVSYVKTEMGERSTIRKLVRRIETLEGVPMTPDNSQPSRRVFGERGPESSASA